MSEEEATELGILTAGVHLHLALLQKIADSFFIIISFWTHQLLVLLLLQVCSGSSQHKECSHDSGP